MDSNGKPEISGRFVEKVYCHKCSNKTFEELEEGMPCPHCGEPLKKKLFKLADELELGRLGQRLLTETTE